MLAQDRKKLDNIPHLNTGVMKMATRKPATPKTSAELKLQLADARKKLADLERRAYAEELNEMIAATSIVADFKKIHAAVKDITETAILAAIGDAVGIKRLEVKQSSAPARKPADPNKPRKPRAAK
jgi:hypothetical protein